ncbi:MAG: CvpA family protein [Acidimicrobiales bacterium]
MSLLDVAIVAVAVVAAVGGYRLGLVVGGTSWVFLLQGLVAASLASPLLVDSVGGGNLAARLGLGCALFLGAGWGAQLIGRQAGRVYRRALVPSDLLQGDKVAGAVVGPLTVLVVVWLLVVPAMEGVPGWPSKLARTSIIGQGLQAALPGAPDTSNALHRLTRPVAQPEVLTALGPAGDSSPPPKHLALSRELVARISASTVKLEGDACFFDRQGSGFAVASDLVVTNAHVVAGEDTMTIVRPDGKRLAGTVVVYDAQRDLALLRVKNLGQEPLPLGTAREGTPAAVFGHPDGQDALEVSPADIRQQLVATIRDPELAQPSRRSVFVLAADLAPGDSGGALVTATGHVAGVAFAVSNSREGVAFAVTSDEIHPLLALDRSGVADTGTCF